MATWRPPFFPYSLPFRDLCAALGRAAVQHSSASFGLRAGSFGRKTARLRVTAKFQRERLPRRKQVLLERRPPFRSDDPALIEVERPSDLNLNRMDSVGGRAEMLGDIAPSEWLIAADAIARALEARFQNVNDHGRRACAISVAQHNIESTDIGGVRGHRVAVEQHRHPKPAARALDQGLQLRMIRTVQRLDPAETVSNRNRFPVDWLRVPDHPGNRAEPNRNS